MMKQSVSNLMRARGRCVDEPIPILSWGDHLLHFIVLWVTWVLRKPGNFPSSYLSSQCLLHFSSLATFILIAVLRSLATFELRDVMNTLLYGNANITFASPHLFDGVHRISIAAHRYHLVSTIVSEFSPSNSNLVKIIK